MAACISNGTTNAHFVNDTTTNDPIVYSKYDPGIWYWEYNELDWTPPNLNQDPNYWFTLITVQKGQQSGSTWTPAPNDPEGINESPNLAFLGRVHDQIMQIPGLANDQVSVMKKMGAKPATWKIPPAQNDDLTPNPYRDFRFLLYNVSRLGTDTSGSGGAGTYTLQNSCWPGGASYFILTPQPKNGSFDMRAANPNTIELPLTGGNGLPMTVAPNSISGAYLGPQSVAAVNMAQNAITAANQALAAGAVVDSKVHDVSINKVTYGTTVFAGDVVLSRGLGLPVIVLQNTGIFLYGQADASTGTTGLTSKPYVAVQNNAIGLFQGAPNGGSIFLDAVANAITIYAKNGDTTFPYTTVSSSGLSMVNGPNSMSINTNAMSFIDTQFHNRIDINSAGISIYNSSTNNRLVITSAAIQLQFNNSPRVTIDGTNGIVLSNGGTSSVTISASTVAIVNGTLTLNLNGVTTTIANQTSAGAAGAGMSIKDNALGIHTVITPYGFVYMNSTNSVLASIGDAGSTGWGNVGVVDPTTGRTISLNPHAGIFINGVQVVTEQYTAGLATLADVIACIRYHGLSA
jgi:hypothetical protein